MKTLWDNIEYFENLVAEYADCNYAVAVDSCTNALFLSMMYCRATGNLPDNNTIEIPNRTYISVPMQAIHAGFNVDLVDIFWSGAYKINSIPVVDSAQRFTEGMYRQFNDTLYCLSFHSKKILSIGRGGMILTNDINARDWLRRSRYDGRSSLYYNNINNQTVPTLGWHMYMTPEEAVRGVEQFYKLPTHNDDSGCSDDYGIDLSTLNCLQ